MSQLDLFGHILQVASSQKQRLQNLSSLVLIQSLVAFFGMITQIKIANVLGRENFGLLAYGMAVATYGSMFVRFGLDKTLVRDLIHFPQRYTAIVKASLALRFTLLTLAITGIFAWKFFAPATSDLAWGVILIIIANTCLSIDLQGVFDSWHLMSRHALYFLLQKGLYYAVIWTIVVADPAVLSLFAIGAAMILTVFVYLVLQYTWVINRLPASDKDIKIIPIALEIARSNIVVWLAAVGLMSFGPLNQIMLKHFYGPAELGGYAVAWMMVTLASILLTQVARIGNPVTAQLTAGAATNSKRIRFLLKYVGLMVTITIPVALPAIIAPNLILETFFRPEYISAAPVLRIMGFYVFIVAVDLVATQYVLSARMEKSYLLIVLSASLVSLLLCLILIPAKGAVGAAWALLISHGLLISLYWMRIRVSLKN